MGNLQELNNQVTGHNGAERRVTREPEAKALAIIHPDSAIADVKSLYTLMKDLYNQVLVKDIDYGIIPGTGDKPTLLLPGMEKICRALRAVPEYTESRVICDYDKPLFHYEYECRLMDAVTGIPLPGGVGKGACTSYESSFRWRWVDETKIPTNLDKTTLESRTSSLVEFGFAIDKAETTGQYGKPESYWKQFQNAIQSGKAKKITRLTAKGKELDAWEIGGTVYRIPNSDIFDQVNAILKRAKKRALGDAVKGAAAVSEFFTVDLEDMHTFPSQYTDIVEAEFTEVSTTLIPPAEKPDPKPDTPQVAYNLSEVMSKTAFLYDHPNHHKNSIPAMIEVGEIEPGFSTERAIWTVFMHRCLSLKFADSKVYEALTAFREAEGSKVPVASINQWVADGGTLEQAWQAVKAYKALEDTPPATPKTGQTILIPPTARDEMPL
jgi:hypothetical protein